MIFIVVRRCPLNHFVSARSPSVGKKWRAARQVDCAQPHITRRQLILGHCWGWVLVAVRCVKVNLRDRRDRSTDHQFVRIYKFGSDRGRWLATTPATMLYCISILNCRDHSFVHSKDRTLRLLKAHHIRKVYAACSARTPLCRCTHNGGI